MGTVEGACSGSECVEGVCGCGACLCGCFSGIMLLMGVIGGIILAASGRFLFLLIMIDFLCMIIFPCCGGLWVIRKKELLVPPHRRGIRVEVDSRAGDQETAIETKVVFPGRIDFDANWDSGVVTWVNPGGQAERAGVKAGWQLHKIEGYQYTEGELDAFVSRNKAFSITFRSHKDPASPEGNPSFEYRDNAKSASSSTPGMVQCYGAKE